MKIKFIKLNNGIFNFYPNEGSVYMLQDNNNNSNCKGKQAVVDVCMSRFVIK